MDYLPLKGITDILFCSSSKIFNRVLLSSRKGQTMVEHIIPCKEDSLEKVKEYFKDKEIPSIPLPLSYYEELEIIWGKRWGAQSEIGKLRATLVQRPGKEVHPPEADLAWYQLVELPDVEQSQADHDGFVEILKKEGVTVHNVSAPERWLLEEPYGVPHVRWGAGARDPGMMINGGAIISRMSLPYRRGEEVWWCKTAVELGSPVLYTVHGNGTFEGGNVVWLDPAHICIGKSARTNQDGIDQISPILKAAGVEDIRVVPIPGWINNLEWPAGGFAHLDVVFGYVDDGLAIIYPPGVPYDFIEYLRDFGINMIEVWPEDAKRFACNIVALQPGKILMIDGIEKARKDLEREGVDVIQVPWKELEKAGGGLHCATGPLIRDPGPKLG
jgi:N-dimethylarginine dimethylaminohydrolase